jgi:hypothetical protein
MNISDPTQRRLELESLLSDLRSKQMQLDQERKDIERELHGLDLMMAGVEIAMKAKQGT